MVSLKKRKVKLEGTTVMDNTCASHAGNKCLSHCDANYTAVFQNSRVTYIPSVKKSH